MDKEILLKLLGNEGERERARDQVLKLLSSMQDSSSKGLIDIEKYIENLKDLYRRLKEKNEIKTGDIVKWKKGLKNKNLPRYDEPSIVVDVLKEPIIDPAAQNAGTPYFNEQLDLVLGIITEDDNFLTFYYSSDRFELFRK